MDNMGMTDKQFNGFLRLLIDRLQETNKEDNQEVKSKKIDKIIDDLQKTIEDWKNK